MKRLSWINTPIAPAIIIAVCYIVFFACLLKTRHNDVSIFVIAGGPNVDAQKVPPGLTVIPNIGGYDGLTFYRLALDPFTSARTAFGITLDNPSYRNQRIAYPFIVWMFSLGQARWVPFLLVAVNIAAAALMAASAGAFAKRIGQHALWGLIVPLYPGFVLTLSRDLAEIVASMFAMGAIWAITARRNITAAILLTCAVLTREPTMLLALALGGAWLIERLLRRERRMAPITFLTPIVVDVAWQIVLTLRWGVSPLRSGAPATALPFVEFAHFLGASAARRTQEQRINFLECLFLAAVVMAVVWIWRRTRAPIEWRLAWLGYLALAAILPHTIWMEDYGFLRIFADLFLVSAVMIIASTTSSIRWFTLLAAGGLWYHLAKYLVRVG
ncbi:MAG: hypothetical protein QOC81_4611 [Thermoanaerobaculia bacterium]|jgi:hypothetical protein|nr:hypothetical protein [Thermoanaerobaculia bacterium]